MEIGYSMMCIGSGACRVAQHVTVTLRSHCAAGQLAGDQAARANGRGREMETGRGCGGGDIGEGGEEEETSERRMLRSLTGRGDIENLIMRWWWPEPCALHRS